MKRQKLPNRRITRNFEVGEGKQKIYVQVGLYPDGSPGDVFLENNHQGTFFKDILHSLAISISLALQHGVSIDDICYSFRLIEIEGDLIRVLLTTIKEVCGGTDCVPGSSGFNRENTAIGSQWKQANCSIF